MKPRNFPLKRNQRLKRTLERLLKKPTKHQPAEIARLKERITDDETAREQRSKKAREGRAKVTR